MLKLFLMGKEEEEDDEEASRWTPKSLMIPLLPTKLGVEGMKLVQVLELWPMFPQCEHFLPIFLPTQIWSLSLNFSQWWYPNNPTTQQKKKKKLNLERERERERERDLSVRERESTKHKCILVWFIWWWGYTKWIYKDKSLIGCSLYTTFILFYFIFFFFFFFPTWV